MLLPCISKALNNIQKLNILIDTGTSLNYIKNLNGLKNVARTDNSFTIKTVGGETYVINKCDITLFGEIDTFFV